jgi:hypothetical protein
MRPSRLAGAILAAALIRAAAARKQPGFSFLMSRRAATGQR